jgi:hypothetical protein
MLSDKQSIFVFRSMAFEGVGAFEIDKRTFILELIFTLLPKSQIRIISISERKKKNLIHFASMFFLVFTPHTTISFMILSPCGSSMGSRCLISFPLFSQCKWLDGLYLMEIDRVLRPGGYWIFSGPPINWKANYKGSEVGAQELEQEQARLEDLAVRLCWKKVAEKGAIAVWRKPNNHIHCIIKSRIWKSPRFCINSDPDAGW